MIKVVIVDDEEFCVEVLETLILTHFSALTIVGAFTDPKKALESIPHLEPDLVFLDINMPRINGFELLDRLMPFSFRVIFTTAYDSYAIKALKYGAIDYLMKPISGEDLKETLSKSVSLFSTQNEGPKLIPSSVYKKRISIVNNDGMLFQPIDEIAYCEADNSYTYFHLLNGKKIVASKTLKDFESILDGHQFYRIHNSYLVNLNHVEMYIRADGGSVVVNGMKLPVSRTKKEEFVNVIQKFHQA